MTTTNATADPDEGHDDFTPAFQALIASYARVVWQASTIARGRSGVLPRRHSPAYVLSGLFLRFLMRVRVHAALVRLESLLLHAQHSGSRPGNETIPHGGLQRALDYCQTFRRARRFYGLTPLVQLAVAFAAVRFVLPDFTFGVGCAVLALTIVGVAAGVHRRRALLEAPADPRDRGACEQPDDAAGPNLLADEKAVFDLLGGVPPQARTWTPRAFRSARTTTT